MKKNNYKIHIMACVALFTAGNMIITQPFYNKSDFLPVFLLTVLFSLAFTFISIAVVSFAFKENCSVFHKILQGIIGAMAVLAAIYGAFSTFFDYVTFVGKAQLPQMHTALIAAVMLGFVAVFIKTSHTSILKLGLFMATLSATVVVLLFTVSVKMLDFDAVSLNISLSSNDLVLSFKCFLRYFSPALVTVLFVTLANGKAKTAEIFGGLGIGFIIILITAIQSIFILGNTGEYEFAYLDAVGAFSSGSLFSRLDGLVYFLFFATATVKIAVCVKTLPLIIKRLKRQRFIVM
ncbi:MAG: hypothetical protein IJZ21_04235 [Clostridia bacterium]|nr:hypothetical protein [Clostridia bacterium]